MSDQSNKSIDNKRITKNAFLLYLRMIITMGISIYTSRVILDVLGVEDYGIYNVVAGVTTMVIFFSGSLSNAAQRYFSLGLGKCDLITTNKYFSQFMLIFGVLAIAVLLLGESLSIWVIESLLVIPADRIEAAYWVYHCSLISMALTFIQIPYQSAIIAHERMDTFAYLSLFESFGRLGILYLIVVIGGDSLTVYALLFLAISFCLLLLHYFYCRIKFEDCKYRYYFSKRLAYEMTSFVGYNMFGCFAFAAANQGVNVLLNIFFGPTVNAARAIAMQVNAAIVKFTDNIVVAVRPGIIKLYAQNQIDEMLALSINSVRYCLYVNFLVAIPIVLNLDFILNLWLKQVPEYTEVFIILILIEGIFNIVNQPITILVNATGKLKRNQFYGRMYTLAVLPISYLLLLVYKTPTIPMSVCVLGTICYMLNNIFDVKNQLGLNIVEFIRITFCKTACVFVPLVILCWLSTKFLSNGWLCMIVTTAIDILIGLTLVYHFLLGDTEKKYVNRIILKYIKR